MSDDLAGQITHGSRLKSAQVSYVMQRSLDELQRLVIDKGLTATMIEACLSFGAEAAFHFIGLCLEKQRYQGCDDQALLWIDVLIRFMLGEYREGEPGCGRGL